MKQSRRIEDNPAVKRALQALLVVTALYGLIIVCVLLANLAWQ